MRTVRLTAVSMIFAAVFAVSAFAQAPTGKIGLISTYAFGDEKTGITKFVTAMKTINEEFKRASTEIQGLRTRYQNLANEVKKLQDQLSATTGPPIDKKAVQTQLDA